jgi:hypothetical protein
MALTPLALKECKFNLVHTFVIPTMVHVPRDLSEEETARLIAAIKATHESPKTPEDAALLQVHIMEALTVKKLLFMGWVHVGDSMPIKNLFEDPYEAYDSIFDILLSYEPDLRKWEYTS